MEGQSVAPKTEAPKQKRSHNKAGIITAAVAAVVVCAYLGLCAWVGSDQLMPNSTISGVDVSGMTWEDAQSAVNKALEEHSNEAVVTLTYDSWSGAITGDQLNMSGKINAESLAESCQTSFLARGYRYISSLCGKVNDIPLNLEALNTEAVDAELLTALLDKADEAAGGDRTASSYEVKEDKLVFTKGVTSHFIKRENVADNVVAAFQTILPAVLSGQDSAQTVALETEEIQPKTPDFNAIHTQVYRKPADAYMNSKHKVENHVVGVDFKVDALQSAYESAAEGATFSIPLTLSQPSMTKDKLEGLLFRDLLGSGTSTVGGSANRKNNVKLAASACNGVILLPGEVFSYNNTTGQRSASKGYLPAGVYVGGASVDEVGGGICQVSSTIYYTILHTTLQIVERHDHKYAVGYVPDGMDATVYYGSLDFRFKNNTNYPIKIVTQSYDSGGSRKLTVKIYGTNETGRYGVPKSTQYDWVQPTTSYVADSSVPRGTLVLDRKQNAYTGVKASTVRYIYEKNGTLVEKQNMGVSKYDMRPKLYHYNPLDGSPSSWPNGVPPKPAVTQKPAETPSTETPSTETATPN